ncbi:hypothetical protein R3X27_02665 [Tropicimonas sp. TH_r6]|uniref:EF-hand domain-containing protein n=1 Tax=Tropicimonas sp. TH_r6 TaxID=3082085 RepID=UPI002952AE9F|nr:hypothetical protein [Tropicimonas sp. TH_r6]MDV7141577.1 hypothetical protein [Tropicimonas sp. TH_r6]
MIRFALPIAMSLALLGTSAPAQQFVPMGNALARWDANNDGRVTLTEIETGRAALFRAYDSNGDGGLSAAEFDRITPKSNSGRQASTLRSTQGALRTQIDTNGDGRVSQREYVAGARLWRDRLDSNGDGVLTAADFGRAGRGAGQGRGMRWNNG